MRLYLLAIVMFVIYIYIYIYHHLREIPNQNVHNFDLDLLNGPWSNVNMSLETPYATLCVAIAMVALSVTVCEILTVEIFTMLNLTFSIGQGQM